MILFLEFEGQGRRGGELYHHSVRKLLNDHFGDIIPETPELFPHELRNPVKHMRNSLARVKRYRPKVVICDISSAARNFMAVSRAMRDGAKILLIIQGQRYHPPSLIGFRRRWVEWAENLVLRRANLILANSKYSASIAESRGATAESTIIAYPGLEVVCSEIRPVRRVADQIRLLFVGECSRVKGLTYLVEAMAQLQTTPIVLDVAGGHEQEPGYFHRVQQFVNRHRISDRITFHGFLDRSELDKLYEKADILVVPSLTEGYGMVVAEAFCYGLPVIGTSGGALSEIIAGGENGLLVPTADSGALARAILRLAEDTEARHRIAMINFNRAPELPTWEDFHRKLESDLVPVLESWLQV